MKGGSDIISAIHCMKQAHEHFQSFAREYPGTKGERLMNNYSGKLEWFAKDLITHPSLPEGVREGIRKEWQSDVFAVPAINEKISLLNPAQREMVEAVIDALLKGEQIEMTAQ